MKKNIIFVGVITYTTPQSKGGTWTESIIFVAEDFATAERETHRYALENAKETNLIHTSFRIFVQAQHTWYVEHILTYLKTGVLEFENIISPTPGESRKREKIPLRIGGKDLKI